MAMENTKLMTWTSDEIEELYAECPRLAIALLQLLVERMIELGQRIESFSVDNIVRRLARSPAYFAPRTGADR
jgi:hypothetical protein